MKSIFVTGTDTGVGKTVVARLLAGYFRDKGKSAVEQKWVVTGEESLRSGNLTLSYSFKLAASPHLASCSEGKSIDKKKIKRLLRRYVRRMMWWWLKAREES